MEQYSYATCTNEGWNTVQIVMQLVQMRILAVELRVQHSITMATKLFRPITDHGMHGEGDTAHNNIIRERGSVLYLGMATEILNFT